MISAPLPQGCESIVMSDQTGSWPAVRFPNGTDVDAALAPFWRYDDDLWLAFEPDIARKHLGRV